MIFLTGKVQVIIAVANPTLPVSIVDYSLDEAGLYVHGVVNHFGTNLAVRGSRSELEAFLAERRAA